MMAVLLKKTITSAMFCFNGGNGSMDTCGKLYTEPALARGFDSGGNGHSEDSWTMTLPMTDHSPGYGSALPVIWPRV